MKSERQRKLDKHANMSKNKRLIKWLALSVSALVVSIPLYLKYFYR